MHWSVRGRVAPAARSGPANGEWRREGRARGHGYAHRWRDAGSGSQVAAPQMSSSDRHAGAVPGY
jgi:hypothetical protein